MPPGSHRASMVVRPPDELTGPPACNSTVTVPNVPSCAACGPADPCARASWCSRGGRPCRAKATEQARLCGLQMSSKPFLHARVQRPCRAFTPALRAGGPVLAPGPAGAAGRKAMPPESHRASNVVRPPDELTGPPACTSTRSVPHVHSCAACGRACSGSRAGWCSRGGRPCRQKATEQAWSCGLQMSSQALRRAIAQ